MVAGLFGYLGYDMVRLMERLPDKNPDLLGVPEAILLRPTVIAIFDNVEDLVTVVTPVWPSRGPVDARAAYDQACERLAEWSPISTAASAASRRADAQPTCRSRPRT